MKQIWQIFAFLGLFLLSSPMVGQDFSSENFKKILTQEGIQRWTAFQHFQNGNEMNATMPICVLDNIFVFNASNSYQVFEGNTKCNPNDNDEIFAGSWSYQAASQTLTLSVNGVNMIFWQILKLQNDTIEVQVMDNANTNNVYIIVLKVLID